MSASRSPNPIERRKPILIVERRPDGRRARENRQPEGRRSTRKTPATRPAFFVLAPNLLSPALVMLYARARRLKNHEQDLFSNRPGNDDRGAGRLWPR